MRRIIAVAVALLVSLVGVPQVAAQTAEGIQVHGHWKVEILEPDGMLVSVTEFENALYDSSALLLVLDSDGVVGTMSVRVWGPSGGSHPCGDGAAATWPCDLAEPGADWGGPADSSNLSITSPSQTLVLSGSVTAVNATTVAEVWTEVKSCFAAVSPTACLTEQTFLITGLTHASLASPPAVAVGQIIQVTVTISFS